jgi:hypothetical protein
MTILAQFFLPLMLIHFLLALFACPRHGGLLMQREQKPEHRNQKKSLDAPVSGYWFLVSGFME